MTENQYIETSSMISINLQSKLMGWFLYNYDLRHERVKTTGRIEAFSGNVKIDFSAVTEN